MTPVRHIGRRALLLGGTGRTGRKTAVALAKRGLQIRALVGDVAGAEGVLPKETELVQGRVQSQSSLEMAMSDVDLIVFTATAIGSRDSHPSEVDFEGVARTAKVGMKTGVRHFILLSSASVTQPEHPHNATFKNVLKYKAKGENSLRESGLPYTVVRALGLRDRQGELCGVRMLQGDRLAFGEDIARMDVASFLADLASEVIATGDTAAKPTGFSSRFDVRSLTNATIEIYNDGRIDPGRWESRALSLERDDRDV